MKTSKVKSPSHNNISYGAIGFGGSVAFLHFVCKGNGNDLKTLKVRVKPQQSLDDLRCKLSLNYEKTFWLCSVPTLVGERWNL